MLHSDLSSSNQSYRVRFYLNRFSSEVNSLRIRGSRKFCQRGSNIDNDFFS